MKLFSMNKNNIICILFLFSFLLCYPELPDFNNFKWNKIREDKISIEYYKDNDITWCKSYMVTKYSIKEIADILEDKANYPNVFKRITETILYSKDIVHIKLDMPFPWSGRDYIVKYTEFSEDNIKEYMWANYDELNIPVEEDYVRLHRAAGKWRLIELEDGRTQVEYIWNGELLGDFPSWALKIAWKEQGNEVLNWLIDYLDNK